MGTKTPPFIHYPKWTEAKFFGFLRSALRKASQKYPPAYEALALARRPYKGSNTKQKWEYRCAECKKWFMQKEVQVDHIIPAGTLKSFNDLPTFCSRLFCGVRGYQVLCKPCHLVKSKEERANTTVSR
jgi:5-methylcytosine-specific restriction endonuclease McrA